MGCKPTTARGLYVSAARSLFVLVLTHFDGSSDHPIEALDWYEESWTNDVTDLRISMPEPGGGGFFTQPEW